MTQEYPEKVVPLGLEPPGRTVGLTGLCPLEVVKAPPASLRRQPGTLHVWIELPQGCQPHPERPITYRVSGAQAGLLFDHDGEIVNVRNTSMPLELPYQPRRVTAPPRAAEMALDLSFWYVTSQGTTAVQDVQWRQPIQWLPRGTTHLELRYTLKA